MLVVYWTGLSMERRIAEDIQRSGVYDPSLIFSKMIDFIVMSKSDSTIVIYASYFKKWEKYSKWK